MSFFSRVYAEDRLSQGYMRYLAIFAILVIPTYTFLFGTKESPFYFTLSMIGNLVEYRTGFIIWGVVTGLLLTFYIYRLYVLKAFFHRKAKKLLIGSLFFLVLTVLIPAVEELPFWNSLHAVVAVLFAFSLTASLYLFIRYLAAIDEKITVRSTWMLFSIIGISVGLFFILGNTGIFELFFFLSISAFLVLLKVWLKPYQNQH
ncbi:hypothetical protein [Lunatimonas salinarum]|uniref:hypothetical protein n=1 Tax=Lunatimonas salinarum TaxID=1774590 RepID=UPI001ADF42C2|nr:hypothetical protein [Lunatimonas salinarum]